MGAFRIVYILLLMILSSKVSLCFRTLGRIGSKRYDFVRMVSSNVNRPVSFQDIQSLLADVGNIIRTTGLQTSITRTVQASQSFLSILQTFAQDPTLFQDSDGNILPAKILRILFEKLGATYIKLGQFIASSPTLFPAEYVLEFQSCLDNSPTVPYSEIRKTIQEELQRPISSVFSSVDPVPLASASIAQVHRAKLRDGTNVVIKVRKPDVAETLKADLGFLYAATKLLEYINPSLSRISLSAIVGDIRESMLKELDFTLEADNLVKFREFLERKGTSRSLSFSFSLSTFFRLSFYLSVPNYIPAYLSLTSIEIGITEATAPKPYPNASGVKVLTMDYLKGVPLVDLEGIRMYSDNPEATLIAALRTWATSVADNDFFHADVHGGNLLVLEDGRIGFIDFGIVGSISDTVWSGMGDLVQAFVMNDYRGIADGLVRIGATDSKVDIDKFGNDLKDVIEKISTMSTNVVVQASSDGQLVGATLNVDERETTEVVLQIVRVAENNGLKLPREFGLLLKQALYFDRYQKLLAPSLDPLRDSRVRDAVSDYTSNKRIIDVDIVEKE